VPTNKKVGLGKGFASLIPQNFDRGLIVDDQERIQKIALENLSPNPNQPRISFDKEALEELAQSIKRHGVLQPLIVTPIDKGTSTIIAGERRWRAAKLAGLAKVPVIIRSSEKLERLEIALIENVQREDLSPLEQAVSIEYLHQQFSMTYESIAKRLGKGSSTVNNIVRLLQLPEDARKALMERKIVEGHARAILAVKDFPGKQTELLDAIQKHGWSVRQAERFVVSLKEGYQDSKSTRERMSTVTPQTKRLGKRLGASVQIHRMAKGGRLEIAFASDEQLDTIMKLLA
jgi:ParB family transcriptional regulator, chromosome partitioning protein